VCETEIEGEEQQRSKGTVTDAMLVMQGGVSHTGSNTCQVSRPCLSLSFLQVSTGQSWDIVCEREKRALWRGGSEPVTR
jgi:hypothetical protein